MDNIHEDSIAISNLKVGVRVGITAAERSNPQEVAINLELVPGHSLSGLDDEISNTVDYYSVYKRVIEEAEASQRCLIETMAEELADILIGEFNLIQISVEIRKFILPETDYVAVRLVKRAKE
jgi:dihydroneopterin aldolase